MAYHKQISIFGPHLKTFINIELMPPRKKLISPLGRLIENTSFSILCLYALVSILFFAILYTFIPSVTNKGQTIGFCDALYFSVTTFSSLGYGDITPRGIGKAITSIEVLTGITSVAFLVGKLASERQSALMLLLYTSEQQSRISGFTNDVSNLQNKIATSLLQKNSEELNTLSEASANYLSSICSYLILHANQGAIAEFGNISSLRRLYSALYQIQLEVLNVDKFLGLSEKAYKSYARAILKIANTASVLHNFHEKDKQGQHVLEKLSENGKTFHDWRAKLKSGTEIRVTQDTMTDDLLERIFIFMPEPEWNSQLLQTITKHFGIKKSVAQLCINTLLERHIWRKS